MQNTIIPKGSIRNSGNTYYRDDYVRLPDRRFHYLDYGGTGEVVVALHGYVQNAHAFDGIASVLVPHARLLAVDLRGRGGSDWGAPDDYRINQYFQDLRDFFRVLGLSKFALIGTSMGAVLAFLYAIIHPSEVTRLVLNDFTLDADLSEAATGTKRYARAPASFATIAEALEWFVEERDLYWLDDAARLTWVSHFLCPVATGGFRFNCDPVLLSRAGQKQREWTPMIQRVLARAAQSLAMPVLILRGANSKVTTPQSARFMVELLPAASWVDVPGANHSPTLYEPVARNALREFFAPPAQRRIVRRPETPDRRRWRR